MPRIDDVEYRRLPWRNFLRFVRQRGLVSEEYLLTLQEAWNVQHCRWIRYEDIQAIVIRYTHTREILSAVCGLCALLLGLITWDEAKAQTRDAPIVAGIWGAFTGLLLLLLIINQLRGRTCKLYVQTAVRMTPLAFACREGSAMAALAILRQHILAKQGPLTPQNVPRPQTATPVQTPAIMSDLVGYMPGGADSPASPREPGQP